MRSRCHNDGGPFVRSQAIKQTFALHSRVWASCMTMPRRPHAEASCHDPTVGPQVSGRLRDGLVQGLHMTRRSSLGFDYFADLDLGALGLQFPAELESLL